MLKTKIIKKSSYKNKTIFTMNHFSRGGLLRAPGFTISKSNKFQYFIIKSGHYILQYLHKCSKFLQSKISPGKDSIFNSISICNLQQSQSTLIYLLVVDKIDTIYLGETHYQTCSPCMDEKEPLGIHRKKADQFLIFLLL